MREQGKGRNHKENKTMKQEEGSKNKEAIRKQEVRSKRKKARKKQ